MKRKGMNPNAHCPEITQSSPVSLAAAAHRRKPSCCASSFAVAAANSRYRAHLVVAVDVASITPTSAPLLRRATCAAPSSSLAAARLPSPQSPGRAPIDISAVHLHPGRAGITAPQLSMQSLIAAVALFHGISILSCCRNEREEDEGI
jgi:hypothetical protein